MLTSYRDGKAAELGRGPGAFDRGWEKLGAKLDGAVRDRLLNDKKIFDAKDPKPAAGRAGVATAGPGEASFDEFCFEPATDPPASSAGAIAAAKRKRPPSTFRITAGLTGLRSASIVIVPVTPTKSFVEARASRIRLPSVEPARVMASARIRVAS